MLRQLSAQATHALTQASIPSRPRQLWAHASHTAAQISQYCALNGESLSCKLAAVWQTSAQLIIRRKWLGSTCWPPRSRQ